MAYPEPHIHHPSAPNSHTHTLIFLPGRSTTGPELFSDLEDLPARLPTVRFVFLTATTQVSTVFQEDLTEWFDIYSLSDPDAESELQLPGLRQAVRYIDTIVEAEMELLGGDIGKLILAGMSMGMATALVCLLSGRLGGLGGFIGVSGWCPFGGEVEAELNLENQGFKTVATLIKKRLGIDGVSVDHPALGTTTEIPIFIGHGEDDAYVDVELGRRVVRILELTGMKNVVLKTYTGAEEEGHWIKEPEEVDDIVAFLESVFK